MRSTLISTILMVTVASGPAFSHSGGLNAHGCHAGSQPYHCHRPAPAQNSIPNTRDLDCLDFVNWLQAQQFFENSGPGDPHRLDADSDGVACENLRLQKVDNLAVFATHHEIIISRTEVGAP